MPPTLWSRRSSHFFFSCAFFHHVFSFWYTWVWECMYMYHLLLFRLHSVWISMNFKQIINSQLEYIHCIPLWFSWLTEQYHLCSASYAFSTCFLTLFVSLLVIRLLQPCYSFFWFLLCHGVIFVVSCLIKNYSGKNETVKCFDFGEFSFIVWIYKTLFFNLLIGFKMNKKIWNDDGEENLCMYDIVRVCVCKIQL